MTGYIVFPARAGMSLEATSASGVTSSVPRASGDEPKRHKLFEIRK